MKNEEYKLNDIVEMKKPHPCVYKSKQFLIIRIGSDIKIKCLGCNNIIMMPRFKFNESAKKIIKKD